MNCPSDLKSFSQSLEQFFSHSRSEQFWQKITFIPILEFLKTNGLLPEGIEIPKEKGLVSMPFLR